LAGNTASAGAPSSSSPVAGALTVADAEYVLNGEAAGAGAGAAEGVAARGRGS